MRLVLAGIPLAIARRVLLSGALVLLATLAVAAPSFAAATDVLGALPPQAAQQLDAAVATLPAPPQPVQRAVEAVPPAADVVRKAPQSAAAPVEQTVSGAPPPAGPGRVDDPVAAVDDAAATVQGAATDVRRRAPALPASPIALPALDETLRGLGDTLRGRLDSLVGAVAPLLADIGLGQLTHVSPARPATPGSPAAPLPGTRLPSVGTGDLVGTHSAGAPHPSSVPLISFKAASAQRPAAEAGGRPGSPIPRKAPAPAGGAAAPAPGGSLFVPLLALLVLAALAAPRLLRRLDAAPALLRPALFVCALERPG